MTAFFILIKINSIDGRGWVVDVVDEFLRFNNIRHIHMVSSVPGAIRGNHYHKFHHEWTYLIGSRAKISMMDVVSGIKEVQEISCEEPWLIDIKPYFAHSIKNIGNDMMYLLSLSDKDYDINNPDVVKVNLEE